MALVAAVVGSRAERAERVEPTSLRLPLNPARSGYVVEPIDAFSQTWSVTAKAPAGETNRLFLVNRSGVIYVANNLAQPQLGTFLDISERTFSAGYETGLLGLAFHPGYATNGYFYVYYSLRDSTTNALVAERVSRFQVDPQDPNRARPDSELPLITQEDPHDSHNGGDLEFGLDGNLYVSVGDGGGSMDTWGNSQRLDVGFFAGILRLDVDRRPGSLPPNAHPSVHPGTYSIPADNPFVGVTSFNGSPVDPAKVRTEFYAVGLRNPFRIAFDAVTGELWANDVGQEQREEINLIRAGGNYGWVYFEGTIQWREFVPAGQFEPPLYEYLHEEGRVAITAGLAYHGTRYPDLDGGYLFADYAGSVGVLHRGPGGPVVQWIAYLPAISDFALNPATGEILLIGSPDGRVYKLARQVVDGPPIPERLSETGLFANVATLTPAPGIIPYEINVPFWSDGAEKRRWFSLPGPTNHFGFAIQAPWQTPVGSVWVKHFDLPLGTNAAAPRRRIETRVLVRNRDGVWGASYRWQEDQMDALLVPAEGRDEVIKGGVVEGAGLPLTQRWRYPSRLECNACHNASAGYLLGFGTAQLNRDVLRGTRLTNQLQSLRADGYFAGSLPHPETLPRLADEADTTSPRSFRVRSFLAANCAYCHHAGGPTRAFWDGRLELSLEETRLVDGSSALISIAGTGAAGTPFVVAPGKLDESALFRRIAELAPYHMPPLATFVLNKTAIGLVAGWITNDLPARTNYSTFQKLALANAGSTQSLPSADPDDDGLSNAMELLLGEDPLNPERHWRPQLEEVDGAWHLRFERRAGLRFEVQWTPDLAIPEWTTVDDPANRWAFGIADEISVVPLPYRAAGGFFRILIQEP